MILIVLIILFISIIYNISGGNNGIYMGIIVTNNKEDKLDNFIYEMYIYKLFMDNSFEQLDKKYFIDSFYIHPKTGQKSKTYISEHTLKNVLIGYFFYYNGMPNFSFKSFDPVKRSFFVFGDENIKILCNYYKKIKKENPNSGLKIINISKEKYVWKFKLEKFMNRQLLGYHYKVTTEEKMKISCFYNVIEGAAPGNHWTLRNDDQIKKLAKKGYIIECFGSSLNTRLKYFGSTNKIDEPFGRIGSFSEILTTLAKNEPLKWKNIVIEKDILNITVSPPSVTSIVFLAHDLIVEVLKNYKGKINILFDLPKTVYYKVDKEPRNWWNISDKWRKSIKKLPYAWDKYGNIKILDNAYWLEIHFSNY